MQLHCKLVFREFWLPYQVCSMERSSLESNAKEKVESCLLDLMASSSQVCGYAVSDELLTSICGRLNAAADKQNEQACLCAMDAPFLSGESVIYLFFQAGNTFLQHKRQTWSIS